MDLTDYVLCMASDGVKSNGNWHNTGLFVEIFVFNVSSVLVAFDFSEVVVEGD